MDEYSARAKLLRFFVILISSFGSAITFPHFQHFLDHLNIGISSSARSPLATKSLAFEGFETMVSSLLQI